MNFFLYIMPFKQPVSHCISSMPVFFLLMQRTFMLTQLFSPFTFTATAEYFLFSCPLFELNFMSDGNSWLLLLILQSQGTFFCLPSVSLLNWLQLQLLTHSLVCSVLYFILLLFQSFQTSVIRC